MKYICERIVNENLSILFYSSIFLFAVSFLKDSIFIPNTSLYIISDISYCELPNEPVAEQICKAMNVVKIEHESSSRSINQNKPNLSSLKKKSNAHVSELTPKQETDRGKIYTNESTLAVEKPSNINGNEYQSGVCCQQEMEQTLQPINQSIQNCFLEIQKIQQEMLRMSLMIQNKQNCISETKDLGNDAHGKINLTYQFIKLKTLQCLREMFLSIKPNYILFEKKIVNWWLKERFLQGIIITKFD